LSNHDVLRKSFTLSAMLFSPEFEEEARALSLRHGRRLALVVVIAVLALWPLDHLFYPDEPLVLAGLRIFRIGVTVGAIGGYLGARFLEDRGGDPFAFLALTAIACAAATGYGVAEANGVERPFFSAAAFLPLATVPMVWPLRRRIVSTTAIALGFVGPYFALRPEHLGHDAARTGLALMVVGAVISILTGDALTKLLLRDHESRRALTARANELEELDQMKNEFFANVSHELRTPLTLILASLKRLGTATADMPMDERPSIDGAIETGLRNAARLLVLIDELLELARFSGDRGEARKVKVDLAALVRGVAASFESSPPIEGELVLTGVDARVGAWVDPRQLRTAVYNLLSNAFKFTEPGERRIQVTLSVDGGDAVITVADNGVGIAEHEQAKVWGRFHQVDSGPTRRRGGTGIGLSLVREIAEAHEGRASVESAPGSGSTFEIRFPRDVPPPLAGRAGIDASGELVEVWRLSELPPQPPTSDATTPVVAVDDTSKPLCLIAEDDPDLRRLVRLCLEHDYRVVEAIDGEDASRLAQLRRPDVVVTDVMMPKKSGYELVAELRAGELARVPVLFLTARAGSRARVEAYDAGADDFLTKPFEEEELRARVANLLAIRTWERELASLNESLEAQVEERTEELTALAGYIETSREDERRRIAREIHDETGQLLTGLRMEITVAKRRADGHEKIIDSLERIDEIASTTLEATRELVQQLRPRVLDDLGLAAAAEWVLERFATQSELEVAWDISLGHAEVSGEPATAAFRILQESLTNVARHAGAERVDVRLEATKPGLSMEILDDGVGVPDAGVRKAGFGVLGMQERARALGGELVIEAREDRGTRVHLSLPIDEEEAAA